jgi:hypothetical protein
MMFKLTFDRPVFDPQNPRLLPWHFDYDTEAAKCARRAYFEANKNNPLAGPCMIYCSCRLCNPFTW